MQNAMNIDKQHAHQLLDQLDPGQLDAVVQLIEVMLHPDDEPLTEEDRRAVAASREWFQKNPDVLAVDQQNAMRILTGLHRSRRDRPRLETSGSGSR